MTTTEAARALGISQATVRQAIARGTLKATKVGRDWRLRPVDVRRYAEVRKA